ncbi:hypothetical protein GG496_001204 [Candidatus Fervidibacteria bacterium JGI MDM2 JNZ-1-D12]
MFFVEKILQSYRRWKVKRNLKRLVNKNFIMKALELAALAELTRLQIKSRDIEFPLLVKFNILQTKGVDFYIYLNDKPMCDYPLRVKVGSFHFKSTLVHAYIIAIVRGDEK